MNTFGGDPYRPSRWIAMFVVAAALAGIAFGVWVFNGLT
jgi:hypothetical protein